MDTMITVFEQGNERKVAWLLDLASKIYGVFAQPFNPYGGDGHLGIFVQKADIDPIWRPLLDGLKDVESWTSEPIPGL